jgi:hypothetical protein
VAVFSADVHRARLRPILEEAAASLTANLRTVKWTLADAPSIHYSLSLLVDFIDQRATEDDLVVVSVKAKGFDSPAWSIDVTRGDGTLIAEDDIASADSSDMSADPDIAAQRLQRFLTTSRDQIAEALSVQGG